MNYLLTKLEYSVGILLQLKGGFGGYFHFRAQFHCSADLPGTMIESEIQKGILYGGEGRPRQSRIFLIGIHH
jgi:hypothetical protein